MTKISGHAGGFEEKVEAAKKAGVGICAILPPAENVCQTEISRMKESYLCNIWEMHMIQQKVRVTLKIKIFYHNAGEK